MRKIWIILMMAASVRVVAQGRLNIRAFGAVGDGKTSNTAAIQRAIDAAAGLGRMRGSHKDAGGGSNGSSGGSNGRSGGSNGVPGGGVVVVPAGRWLTGVLTLRTGVELHLDSGAVLLGSTSRADYGRESASALLVADGQRRVAITGSGTIDGQGREVVDDLYRLLKAGTLQDPDWQRENPWHQKRPNERNRPGLIHMMHCDSLRIEGILLKDAACWVQTYTECTHLTLTGVRVHSTVYWNNDGIDIVDCQDVRISGCDVDADDDGICLKSSNTAKRCERVLVEDCRVRSSASGIKFGTASYGGFKDILIRRTKIRDTYRSAIALECVDGGIMEDVTIEDVAATRTGNALFIRLGHRYQNAPPGIIRRVTVRGLQVEVPDGKPDKGYEMEGPELGYAHHTFPASIVGLPGNPVKDVTLENIDVMYRGAEDKSIAYYGPDSLNRVPEREADYPEFSMFGELPAWGLYVRHVDGLRMSGVTLRHEQTGTRPPLVFDDVRRLVIEKLVADQ